MAIKWVKIGRGIRYREHTTRRHGTKLDRYYTIYYSVKGKDYSEGIGWSSDGVKQGTCEKILMTLRNNHKSGTGGQTYKEIREKNLAQAEEVRVQKAKDAEFTLQFIFEQYLTVQTEKSEKSINAEKQLMKNHVFPFFKNATISEINTVMLDQFLNELKIKISDKTGKNLSSATIRYTIAVIRQVWNYALSREIVDSNFPLRAKQPRQDNKRTAFLTREQAELLLSELSKHSREVHDMALLSLYCGLRQGEIFKLQWGDINFSHGLIYIRDRKNKESGVSYITSKVSDMLNTRYKKQSNDIFVFSNNDGTIKNFMSKTFNRAVDALGFNCGIEDRRKKIVFHSLRHTYASWLAQKGVSMFELAELLGHKDIQMTQRYSHHSPDKLRKSAMLIENNDL